MYGIPTNTFGLLYKRKFENKINIGTRIGYYHFRTIQSLNFGQRVINYSAGVIIAYSIFKSICIDALFGFQGVHVEEPGFLGHNAYFQSGVSIALFKYLFIRGGYSTKAYAPVNYHIDFT